MGATRWKFWRPADARDLLSPRYEMEAVFFHWLELRVVVVLKNYPRAHFMQLAREGGSRGRGRGRDDGAGHRNKDESAAEQQQQA